MWTAIATAVRPRRGIAAAASVITTSDAAMAEAVVTGIVAAAGITVDAATVAAGITGAIATTNQEWESKKPALSARVAGSLQFLVCLV